jgi:arylsulfatase A-like enzyme
VAVPIVFYGPGIAAQRLARRVSTVDIGPTLAAFIGIAPTEAVDGRVLAAVLGH